MPVPFTSPRACSPPHRPAKQASTDAARAAYLSSVFVRAGRAEFSRAEAGIVGAQGTDSAETRASRRGSKPDSTDATTVTSAAVAATSVAVLSGLTFKGQFLRLVLWEAAGSSDNPGRQVGGGRAKHVENSMRVNISERQPGTIPTPPTTVPLRCR